LLTEKDNDEMTPTFCSDCDSELTSENTSSYEGFDSSGYLVAKRIMKVSKEMFVKCDPCFDREIDLHLDNLQS
jgi:hypothetical protein